MSKELDNKYEELKLAQARLKELQFDRDNFEKEVTDEQYDEMLDERYGDVEIAGCSFSTSYALKELDPTAYNCGKNDYEDGLD